MEAKKTTVARDCSDSRSFLDGGGETKYHLTSVVEVARVGAAFAMRNRYKNNIDPGIGASPLILTRSPLPSETRMPPPWSGCHHRAPDTSPPASPLRC